MPGLIRLNTTAADRDDASSAQTEAYATLFYGNVTRRSPAVAGLRVLLHTVRTFDSLRAIAVLRLLDDTEEDGEDAPLASILRQYGAHIVRVPRLVADPKLHPECTRHLYGWANPNGRANGSESKSARAARRWWQTHGAEATPLGVRSVFSVFNVWRLVSFTRVLYVETDQIILRPLDALWSVILPPGTAGAAVPTGSCWAPRTGAAQCQGDSWYVGARNRENRSEAGRQLRRACKWNTGVVLMRPSMEIYTRLSAALTTPDRHRPFTCTDGFQTMWSSLLFDEIACLPRTFNCYERKSVHQANPVKGCLMPSEVDQNRTHPHIWHFAGDAKPWGRRTSSAANQSDYDRLTADLWAWKVWARIAASAGVAV